LAGEVGRNTTTIKERRTCSKNKGGAPAREGLGVGSNWEKKPMRCSGIAILLDGGRNDGEKKKRGIEGSRVRYRGSRGTKSSFRHDRGGKEETLY